jgi:excisionase family DNA binding protein
MAQQYYTLEEAAKVLQMPADELREMAKKKEIRAFQDRGNWRFRAQDIDEEARKRGIGSEPDLQLGDALKHKASKQADDALAVDFNLDDDAVPLGKDKDPRSTKSGPRSPSPKSSGSRSPKPGSDSDVRLVMEGSLDFQIDSDVKMEPSGPKGSGAGPKGSGAGPKSSGAGPKSSGARKSKMVADSGVRMVDKPSDSDVKVIPSEHESAISPKESKSQSDSDIRLDKAGKKKDRASDAGIITEEIDLDAEEARLSAEGKAVPKSKPMTKAGPQLPTSSPFELSESDLSLESGKSPKGSGARAKPAKKPDSSSDFELIPFDESKSPTELGSGEIPLLSGNEEVGLGDLPAPNAGNSGINLQDPADSGISLESGGSDELEFELSLDSGTAPKTPKPAKKPAEKKPAEKKPAAKEAAKKEPAKKEDVDSSSEFELSLDSSPGEDSSSEFELSLDESSETVGLKSVDESSSSEFELTLDSEGALASADDESKDIFEETNFEVPSLEDESGSEAVAIDEGDTDLEGSDFEISLDESGTEERSDSQVVALEDEEEADDAAATVARPKKTKSKGAMAAAEDESELELDLEDVEGSGPRAKTDEEEEEEVVTVAAPPAEWGALPAILLFPTVIVMFVVGLMGFELVQGMWGYHRPAKVSKLIIDSIARQIDDSLPKDQ